MADPRLSTGVEGLDAMIGGGFLRGDLTLVAGSPGTGKTTLGLHFLAEGARQGEAGVFVTFEYLPQQIYRDAARRGWPLREWEEQGLARLLSASPRVLFETPDAGLSLLDEAIEDVGAKRVVLDSVATWGIEDPRGFLEGIANHLRLGGLTTIVTSEVPQIVGPTVQITPWGLEFLADNVIILQYVEIEGGFRRAINVLKFRGGDHDRKFRELETTDEGLVVAAGFENVDNISSGTASPRFRQRARELV